MKLSELNVKKQRPVNLDLQKIRFPISAIVSILHRISGVILFFSIGGLLTALNYSLDSKEEFMWVVSIFQAPIIKFIIWSIITALIYHMLAGIRHLVMDRGYWEELGSGQASAKAIVVVAIILSIGTGAWIW